MNDKQMYEVLEEFANQNKLSLGITCKINPGGWSFTPSNDPLGTLRQAVGANYEDVLLLDSLVRGAFHFLMWARRNKRIVYKNRKRTKNGKRN